jgi:dTDP-4-dehydrorhamnose 3,5-epimerase
LRIIELRIVLPTPQIEAMPFHFKPLEIPEVILVEPKAFEDERGFFMETYKRSEFEAHGIRESFVQDNYSLSRRRVLRGLHYQKAPKAQGKLISVIRGEIFDVAADIRRGSPTYGHWIGVQLSGDNRRMLYVPAGFAHGFCVLSDEAAVVYKVSQEYAPELEEGVRWDDPELAIAWPIHKPIVSAADAGLRLLRDTKSPFEYRTTMTL